MLKLNKETYMDKLYACWLGKNIGGTLGGPFEDSHDMLDVKGFTTPPGNPLPNDDLDLQLYWLLLLETHTAKNMSAQLLGNYWINSVSPFWNEYGVCKTNLAYGFLPPLCGEFRNDTWKHSNGAWIRSEIWAALAPCVSDVAIHYATMDAMVDHGLGEGTYAEIFTAAMQSAAYGGGDVKSILRTALKKIPDHSRVHQAVSLVFEEYEKGTDYRTVREMLVEQSKDLGWFQAPANLGYVAIGLLYGEGDFKKSVLYAINCGDDTDCTAATVGATMGILHGTKGIPTDWVEYIGDNILTCAINGQHIYLFPKTCKELTERVALQLPRVMEAHGVEFSFTDQPTQIDEETVAAFNKLTWKNFLDRSALSYDLTTHPIMDVRVTFAKEPVLKAGETLDIQLEFRNKEYEVRQPLLRVITPADWTTEPYARSLQVQHNRYQTNAGESWTFTLKAGETVEAVNRVYVEVLFIDCPTPLIVPITVLG